MSEIPIEKIVPVLCTKRIKDDRDRIYTGHGSTMEEADKEAHEKMARGETDSINMPTIEFAGMPRSGKSTQLNTLESILKHERKKKVRIINEGDKSSPIDKDNRFQLNAWSFNYLANILMEAKLTNLYDYLIINRGIYDHIAFTKVLYYANYITEEQCNAKLKYFSKFTSLEDMVILFMIDPELSMERENKNHPYKGRVMNIEFLKLLFKSYEEIKDIPNPKIHGVNEILYSSRLKKQVMSICPSVKEYLLSIPPPVDCVIDGTKPINYNRDIILCELKYKFDEPIGNSCDADEYDDELYQIDVKYGFRPPLIKNQEVDPK